MTVQIPSFPYQAYLDSVGEDDFFPIIDDDGNGFNAISHKIRYPELTQDLSSNLFADSLLQFYNMVMAFNTIAYDVSTAERYMDETDLVLEQADALDSIKLSGIQNTKIKSTLAKVSHNAAEWIRQGKKPNEQENKAIAEFYELYDSIYASFLDSHLSESEYSPAEILKDYQEIHSKAISDTTIYRTELLHNVLQELNFEKKCILAREFAYSNYKNPERDDEQLVAVLDQILRSNQYSPLLGELWLMWRTALQKNILGSPSNDGAMYNIFYNDMRNHVAMLYITRLAEHPEDDTAFLNFYRLAMEWNITRNSPCLFGNNSNLDDMYLYEELWNKKE